MSSVRAMGAGEAEHHRVRRSGAIFITLLIGDNYVLIPIFTLNIENLSPQKLSQDVIETLKKEGLYRDNYRYRGFSKDLLQTMLDHGSDYDDCGHTFGTPEEALGKDTLYDPATYALTYGALAVYKKDAIKEECSGDCFYLNGDFGLERAKGLVAVFLINKCATEYG